MCSSYSVRNGFLSQMSSICIYIIVTNHSLDCLCSLPSWPRLMLHLKLIKRLQKLFSHFQQFFENSIVLLSLIGVSNGKKGKLKRRHIIILMNLCICVIKSWWLGICDKQTKWKNVDIFNFVNGTKYLHLVILYLWILLQYFWKMLHLYINSPSSLVRTLWTFRRFT
jgi:hypothetical protein